MSLTQPEVLLAAAEVTKHFPISNPPFTKGSGHAVKAVDGVTFDLYAGETLGIVGESGSGKSTLARAILGIYPDTRGSVRFRGEDLIGMSKKRRRELSPALQMIFQDPFSALNPRMTTEAIVKEPLINNKRCHSNKERSQKVLETLTACGLSAYHLDRYPHEFSGGQRQRIGIARALVLDPDLVICDEAVSALDVSVQAQIINLLVDLQAQRGFTYIFISHDLSVVEHIANRVGVMYLGRLVELANKNALYKRPKHPYTTSLMAAAPVPDPNSKKERILLKGDIPSPANPPSGCTFHTRCPIATERCTHEAPAFIEKEPDHFVSCHYA